MSLTPEEALKSAPIFPVFLKLRGKRVLIVGAGNMAEEKLPALLDAGAIVDIVAPVHRFYLEHPNLRWHHRPYAPSDLDGVWYVVSAATPEVNREVAQACEARQIFLNAVTTAGLQPPTSAAWCVEAGSPSRFPATVRPRPSLHFCVRGWSSCFPKNSSSGASRRKSTDRDGSA